MTGGAWAICGHQRVAALLAGEIRDQRVRHAYLITGPAFVGKTAVADAFAAALVCRDSRSTGGSCGECDDCRRASRGTHPDIQRFSLEFQRQRGRERSSGDSLTVDTVREITAASAFRAYSSQYRVIIVENADTLTDVAQEALLKTLEEPPPQLVLVLLADRPESLLPTIQSRCEHLALNPLPLGVLTECLVDAGLPPGDAGQLAAFAQGLPGWAFRAIEDPALIQERSHAQHRIMEWVESSPFERIARAFELAQDFSRSREAVFTELDAAVEYWRAGMMNAAGAGAGNCAQTTAGRTSPATLTECYRALQSVTQCASDLDRNVRPRLALEAMVMQWPLISQAGS